jgi:hypothetical protein
MNPLTYTRMATDISIKGTKTALIAIRPGATVFGLTKFDVVPGGGFSTGIFCMKSIAELAVIRGSSIEATSAQGKNCIQYNGEPPASHVRCSEAKIKTSAAKLLRGINWI